MTGCATLVEGLGFAEALRWHDDRLWFSDVYHHLVLAVSLDGTVEEVAHFEDEPSGLGFLPDGTPLVVQMNSKRIVALGRRGNEVFADLSAVPVDRLNDLLVHPGGRIFVGGICHRPVRPGLRDCLIEVGASGCWAVVPEVFDLPNGMVMSADGETFCIAESFGRRLSGFRVGDGSWQRDPEWSVELPHATPDGLALDEAGSVWVASIFEERFLRFTPGTGLSGEVPTPGVWAVCPAVGGPDGDTLFLSVAKTTIEKRRTTGESQGWIVYTRGRG